MGRIIAGSCPRLGLIDRHFRGILFRLRLEMMNGCAKKRRQLDPRTFLATLGGKSLDIPKRRIIFAQGARAEAVFYIQKSKVKLTAVSKTGKEAAIGILNKGNCFGESALTGQPLRVGFTAAMTDCQLLRIDKQAVIQALHRNLHHEEDRGDQLFNSSEKRLARIVLLRMVCLRCGPQNQPGDPGRNSRHHSLTSQFFHQPMQKIGVRSL